jgi:hypothetical protein
VRAAWPLFTLLALGCGPASTPPDGTVRCNPTGKLCPDHYYCVADGTCWHDGHSPGACANHILDPGEADVDCGGPCPPCLVGKHCNQNSDCASGNCDPQKMSCYAPGCVDGVKDGAETDVDCGGGVCPACANGAHCAVNADCAAGMCNPRTRVCAASQCQDGVRDGAETDVDCGGPTCPPCDVDLSCAADSDCGTGRCFMLLCTPVSGPPGWLPAPSVPTGNRDRAAAAVAADGNLYLLGGQNGFGALASVQVFAPQPAPAMGTWSAGVGLPQPREELGAALGGDGKIYVFGGDGPNGTLASLMPGANSWNAGAAMPAALGRIAGIAGPGGTVVALGGSPGMLPAANVQSYSPTAGAWTVLPPMPTAREQLAAAVGADGRWYAIGGRDAQPLTTVEAFAPTANAWTAAAALPSARTGLAAVGAPDGRVYAIGGNSGVAALPEVLAYSPKAARWVTVAPLAQKRASLAAAAVLDGRIFALTGIDGMNRLASVEAYGPSVTLSPPSGTRGGAATISAGANFGPNATVSVHFGNDPTPIATGSTDAAGALTAAITFTVPASAASLYPAFPLFTVTN